MSNIIKGISKLNLLSEIKGNFEGYIWLSDQKNPIILNNESFDFTSIGINPFVVEALLFDKNNNISIHVQQAGIYIITAYNLTGLAQQIGSIIEDKAYLPHRLNGVKKVNFKQIWLPEADENCADMPVLTMKAIIFCGFTL
jgi:CRISPR type III-associated protein (TIGR04423 family)